MHWISLQCAAPAAAIERKSAQKPIVVSSKNHRTILHAAAPGWVAKKAGFPTIAGI
jgi:hypothetical protein